MEITWDMLMQVVPLATIAALVMQVVVKPILDVAFTHFRKDETKSMWRDLAVNVLTFLLCFGLAAAHVGGEYSLGEAFIVGVQAAAVAVGEYEVVKNAMQAATGKEN